MVKSFTVAALAVLAAVCCSSATPLPSQQQEEGTLHAPVSSPESFRVNIHQLDSSDNALILAEDGKEDADEDAPGNEKQLSPSTQSFLATLGTALGPIVGAIVGPLLTNIGQNLAAGSGAQAIAQLQQAAAAAAAQQQQLQGGAAVTAAPVELNSTAAAEVSVTPRPGRPGRPTARPVRPGRPAPGPTTTPTPFASPSSSKPPRQTFDAFVLDVPGKGPFLFLMTPNVSAAEQSVAIQQAQQQAAQLLAGHSSPIGAVASLIGSTTPRPQVTKPTSVGPLPVRPLGVTPVPLPSYHSLLESTDEEEPQQGEEEVAVADTDEQDHIDLNREVPGEIISKEDDSDFSAQSFLERLFPEMV